MEHTDDILCLTVNEHPKFKNIVATGQVGAKPAVHVWDGLKRTTVSVIRGLHTRGVGFLDFSSSGRLLVSVGLDTENSIAVWRWQEGKRDYMCIIHVYEESNIRYGSYSGRALWLGWVLWPGLMIVVKFDKYLFKPM